jgi:rod shape-determining protein MreB
VVTGLPICITLGSEEIQEAIVEDLLKIVDAIKTTLEQTPPELAADVMERGVTLSGGGALICGLPALIRAQTGIDAYVAENPLDCVALGTGKILEGMDAKGLLSSTRR